ncbi:STAS domain-containing protein [Actinokineospora enzanensis]|uniref:STAS domain-containing protein n=1 Tax=Actinokineospora enzanensis TaxID=155975 RepID=UPI00037A033A|nr:STAS domain-containing protein [Actinokineospora enzanensis]
MPLTHSHLGDSHVLALVGEIDLHTAPDYRDALACAAVPRGAPVIIDLRGLGFLGIAGVRVLVEFARNREDVSLLVAPGSLAWRVLEICETDLPILSDPIPTHL